MTFDLIYCYLLNDRTSAAEAYEESVNDGTFHGHDLSDLIAIRDTLDNVLKSKILTKTEADELKEYFEDLKYFINNQ